MLPISENTRVGDDFNLSPTRTQQTTPPAGSSAYSVPAAMVPPVAEVTHLDGDDDDSVSSDSSVFNTPQLSPPRVEDGAEGGTTETGSPVVQIISDAIATTGDPRVPTVVDPPDEVEVVDDDVQDLDDAKQSTEDSERCHTSWSTSIGYVSNGR